MTRGILIATVFCLGVPALAAAKPRKKPKAAKPPPAETSKPDPAPEATTPAPTDTGAAAGTLTPGSGKSGAAGTPPLLGSTPGTPATTPPTTGPGAGARAGNGSAVVDPPEEPPSKELDVDALRQEYLSLRDELFKSRARA